MTELVPIPHPPTIPFLGNTLQVDREVPILSFDLLHRQYGDIFRLTFAGGRTAIYVSSIEMADEVCDEKRFRKGIRAQMLHVRNLVKDGLFSAFHTEENWYIAHRILMSAFSPAAIRDMYTPMTDICSQLIAKWERFGPEHIMEPVEDFTRLAFDTVALCTMSHRLNSFYSTDTAPFIGAMASFLKECGNRAMRPALVQNYLNSAANAQYEKDIKLMHDVTWGVVNARKRSGKKVNDLLGLMLDTADPVTGKKVPDDNIMRNLVTFLIAGHETTSGLLTFTTYYLLKNPQTYSKLRDEVDTVLGKEPFRLEHLNKLPYMTAVFREALRLSAPISALSFEPVEDTVIGGKYKVTTEDQVILLSYSLHRSTQIWGEDAEEFRPERMLDGGFERAPKNAWKPFGNGARGCIGRTLAWQEIHIAYATILQKFDLVMVDPSYTLKLKTTLTIKPADFRIRVIPRDGAPSLYALPTAGIGATMASTNQGPSPGSTQPDAPDSSTGSVIYIAYGSNAGTCKDFASKLAKESSSHGFRANVSTLDTIESKIPTDRPLVVITASYEGQPPDNAARFVDSLTRVSGEGQTPLADLKYAVFGCGHHDWVATYQRIPKLVDESLEKAGGERIYVRGEGDAGGNDLFNAFDEWCSGFWKALKTAYGTVQQDIVPKDSSVAVEVMDSTRAKILQQDQTYLGTVVENKVLTSPGVPVKIHVEITLPKEMTYQAGDYLAILPTNPPQTVKRAISYFGMLPDQQIVIRSSEETALPTNTPISVQETFSGYVELSQTATRKNLDALISEYATDEAVAKLRALDYKTDVLEKRLSVLDILTNFGGADQKTFNLSLADFLLMLPAMRIRQYSISSSPLWNPTHVTLTVSVLDTPSLAGNAPEDRFLGVASNYLANLRAGDKVQVGVRPSNASFHLLNDITVPVIMIAAGSGLAPMRAFIQERATQKASGRSEVGKMILFYGCRDPEQDYLYGQAELKEWEDKGVVTVLPAFSRKSERSAGAKYVQDRLRTAEPEVLALYKQGAKIYVCGFPSLTNSVREYILDVIARNNSKWTKEEVEAAFEKLKSERYSTDVFA